MLSSLFNCSVLRRGSHHPHHLRYRHRIPAMRLDGAVLLVSRLLPSWQDRPWLPNTSSSSLIPGWSRLPGLPACASWGAREFRTQSPEPGMRLGPGRSCRQGLEGMT
jgi:hypothetical protein